MPTVSRARVPTAQPGNSAYGCYRTTAPTVSPDDSEDENGRDGQRGAQGVPVNARLGLAGPTAMLAAVWPVRTVEEDRHIYGLFAFIAIIWPVWHFIFIL